MADIQHILVPTDFSETADAALEMAIATQEKWGASLTLMHAYEFPVVVYQGVAPIPFDYWTPIREGAEQALAKALESLRKQVPDARSVLRHGAPWQEIVEVAKEENASLIVMGTHGRRGLGHVLLGSVAEKVLRHSPVPVLTVRAPDQR